MTNRFLPGGIAACFFLALTVSAARAADAPVTDLPKAPAGWKVELIAKAPQIQHPSVVCCAPDGRIFVGEDPVDMHLPSSAEADRVLCFHPDGRVTVFADKLHAIFGLQYVDGKLYVHHTPKFSVFTDDGSGVGKDRVDLIECTNPNPWATGGFNDHIPANFKLAMDGFFYMSVGDKGIYGAVGKDGSKAELRGGGVIRFRPDGTDLEVFCSGTRNHLDVSMNAEDEMFTYDNTDDGRGWWTRFTHMVDGGFYGYPWDYWPDDATPQKVEEQIKSGKPGQPYTLWRMAEYGGGSPCGAVAYNDDALPPEYRGNLFHCEWGKGHVARFVVERDGGTYKIVKREEFLTPGGEFRPLGITTTPDGLGFIVADWNYGGWKQASEGGKRGRLFRVTWTGKSMAAPRPAWLAVAGTGKPFTAPHRELVNALKHRAQSVRMIAQRRLADRGNDAIAPLVELVRDRTAPPHARWHAIWALDRIDGGKAGRGAIIQTASEPAAPASVRIQALRQLGTRHTPFPGLLSAIQDTNPSVRFHAATAAGRIVGDTAAAKDVIKMLRGRLGRERDFFTHYAVFRALNRIGRSNADLWPSILEGLKSGNADVRAGTSYALRDAYDTAVTSGLLALVKDGKLTPETRAAALTAVAPLYRKPRPWDGKWWGTQPVQSPRPNRELEWAGTADAVEAIQSGFLSGDWVVTKAAIDAAQVAPDPSLADTLVAWSRNHKAPGLLRALAVAKPAAAAELVADILDHPVQYKDVVPDTLAVAEKVGGAEMLKRVLGVLDSEAPVRLKVAALESATRMKGAPVLAVASKLVSDAGAPAELRRAAAASLASSRSPDAVEPLLKAFQDPAVRGEATLALTSIPDVRALDAYLAGLDSKDGTLRQRCRDALKTISGQALPLIEARLDKTPAFSAQVIGELQAVFTGHDPVRQWRVLWPWPSDAADPFPLEAFDSPARGAIKAPDGRELRWRTLRASGPEGMVDLGSDSRSEAYAYAEIKSDARRAVQFLVGSDDRMTLYLNGRRIYQDLGESGWQRDEATVPATLEAGRNVLLAKVGNAGGGWMFSVAVSGERKGKLFEYKADTIDPAAFADYAAKNPGDANRGANLFFSIDTGTCLKCHQVAGQGGQVGPALDGVGAKYDRAKLIESVLYPSKQIFDGYEQTLVRTKDGNTLAGAVRGETEAELTLIDSENQKHVVRKADIDRRKVSELSMMPEGLQTTLKPEEFADLIAYLQSLKDPGPSAGK